MTDGLFDPMAIVLPELSIGRLKIGFPVIQAALSGYSDWPMRLIARRLGAPYTLCEVLLDQFVLSVTRGKKARRFLQVTDEEHPCGAQLMGAKPEDFPPAALKLVEAGFDAIDLNFACPVKKVLGRCRGGYLMSDPATALEIMARCRDAVPEHIPVTVKLRRGMDDTAESRDRFYEIFDGVFRLGAAAVGVHGRTVRQRYEGRCDWEFLREVKRHAGNRTVLGSGDLFHAEDCLAMIAQCRLDGVLAARGAIGNPWIFQQAKDLVAGLPVRWPSLHQQRDVIAAHYQLAESLYGPKLGNARMRKFGIKYARMHPQSLQVRDAFVAVHKPEDWKAVLDRWYADDLPGCRPEPDEVGACEES